MPLGNFVVRGVFISISFGRDFYTFSLLLVSSLLFSLEDLGSDRSMKRYFRGIVLSSALNNRIIHENAPIDLQVSRRPFFLKYLRQSDAMS